MKNYASMIEKSLVRLAPCTKLTKKQKKVSSAKTDPSQKDQKRFFIHITFSVEYIIEVKNRLKIISEHHLIYLQKKMVPTEMIFISCIC